MDCMIKIDLHFLIVLKILDVILSEKDTLVLWSLAELTAFSLHLGISRTTG